MCNTLNKVLACMCEGTQARLQHEKAPLLAGVHMRSEGMEVGRTRETVKADLELSCRIHAYVS